MTSVPGWGSWSLDPLAILALLAAAVLYARMYRRAASRSKAVGAGHWIPYAGGLIALAIALLSPLDAIGDSWLLSAHMAQHVLLSDIAPALLVLGLRSPVLSLGLARPALRAVAPGGRWGRTLAVATSPWVAIPLWALATWVWAIPAGLRLRRPAHRRARFRARNALLHRARPLVADHRSDAARAPAPGRPAPGAARLLAHRLRGGLPAPDLDHHHAVPALRLRSPRLRHLARSPISRSPAPACASSSSSSSASPSPRSSSACSAATTRASRWPSRLPPATSVPGVYAARPFCAHRCGLRAMKSGRSILICWSARLIELAFDRTR